MDMCIFGLCNVWCVYVRIFVYMGFLCVGVSTCIYDCLYVRVLSRQVVGMNVFVYIRFFNVPYQFMKIYLYIFLPS